MCAFVPDAWKRSETQRIKQLLAIRLANLALTCSAFIESVSSKTIDIKYNIIFVAFFHMYSCTCQARMLSINVSLSELVKVFLSLLYFSWSYFDIFKQRAIDAKIAADAMVFHTYCFPLPSVCVRKCVRLCVLCVCSQHTTQHTQHIHTHTQTHNNTSNIKHHTSHITHQIHHKAQTTKANHKP